MVVATCSSEIGKCVCVCVLGVGSYLIKNFKRFHRCYAVYRNISVCETEREGMFTIEAGQDNV